MNGAELTFTRTEQLNDHYPVYQALDRYKNFQNYNAFCENKFCFI